MNTSACSLVVLASTLAGILSFPGSVRAATLEEALDAPGLTWATGGYTPWFSQTVTNHDGFDAAQSGPPLPDNNCVSSWIETTVTGRVSVVFWCKLDSNPDYYTFYFNTNNSNAEMFYGKQNWTRSCVAFESGTNTVRWSLSVGLSPSYMGAAWLDEVVVTNITGLKPTFLEQPAPLQIVSDNYPSTTVLSALVIGDVPMTYYWQHSGTNIQDGSHYLNVATRTLSVWYATFGEAGDYRLIASNVWGMTTSAVSTITVTPSAPFFWPTQPEDATLARGADYYPYVSVYGTEPMSFQWEKNELPFSDHTNSYFSFSNVTEADSGRYRLVATNLYGAATSRVAQITVSSDLPRITVGPDREVLTAAPGGNAQFNVWVAGPVPFSFTWKKLGSDRVLGASDGVEGFSSLNLANLTPADSGFYYVVVANNNGAITSRVSVLAVDPVTPLGLALDAPQLTVTNHPGSSEWTPDVNGTNAHDGICAARSPQTWFWSPAAFSTVVTGPTNVSFWWRISAAPQAFLDIAVDGAVSNTLSGEVPWQPQALSLPAGEHTLTWTFRKDDNFILGQDAAWVDQLAIGGNPNEITTFTTSGNTPYWYLQTTNTHDGAGAWQSGAIEHNQTNGLVANVTGPGTLTFWWQVESEADHDFLEFWLDGSPQASISGQTNWHQRTFVLGAGSHTLEWPYDKDASGSAGADAGWVDEVVFTPTPAPPSLEQALNITNLVFTTGGDAPWFVQTSNVHDGFMAVQSGTIGDNQKSWLRTTVVGPGTLTYWYALSTEMSSDNFFIPWVGYTSGGAYYEWYERTLTIPDGIYTLEWRYEKDDGGSDGSDAVWLDQVVWNRIDTPFVTVGPQWKYPGETCAFTGFVTGTGPFTCQWYRDGAPLEGETGSDLNPFIATYANAGTYTLVAANDTGATTNSAKLTVAPLFYELTDLGSLWPGDFTSYANGVNSHGDVVGHCSTNANDLGHAWVWSGGVLTDLGDALGGGDSQAYAINDQGDIVGTARVPGTTNYSAIRWRKVGEGYVMDDLGRNGWPYAFAPAINNAGDIVFSMNNGGKGGSGNRRAFLWRQGAFLPLGNLNPAWPEDIGDAYGWGINSVGFVVGSANAARPAPGENALRRGWRYNGAWRENVHETYRIASLPGVPGAIDSSGVYAVNDYGDLVGQYMQAAWGNMGCFVTSGTNAIKVTGWYGYVQGLNNHGDLLVSDDGLRLFCSTNASAPARLPDGRPDYSDHALFLVEDLVAGGLGTFAGIGPASVAYHQLSEARAVVGSGVATSGASHAFLATPIARPGNLPPVANPDGVTNSGSTLVIPIATLLANDTDANGDTLALLAPAASSTNGAIIRRSGNSLIYTPTNTPTRDDAFAYTVMDYHGGKSTTNVRVLSQPAGAAPPAQSLVLLRESGPEPRIRFHATPGQTVRIQAADAPTGPWNTIATALAGPDGMVDATDVGGLTRPYRFYRGVSP